MVSSWVVSPPTQKAQPMLRSSNRLAPFQFYMHPAVLEREKKAMHEVAKRDVKRLKVCIECLNVVQ